MIFITDCIFGFLWLWIDSNIFYSFLKFEIFYAFFICMSFLYILDNNFLVVLDMAKIIFLQQILC